MYCRVSLSESYVMTNKSLRKLYPRKVPLSKVQKVQKVHKEHQKQTEKLAEVTCFEKTTRSQKANMIVELNYSLARYELICMPPKLFL